jgi:hypothetical protein
MADENVKQIGDVMADGTIYAGISPDTNRPMYAAPADAPLTMTFNQAAQYAQDLEVGGKKDFRVPSKAELEVLLQNLEKGALKGTFNLSGVGPAGYYLSSTPHILFNAYNQRFADAAKNRLMVLYFDMSVRCVRG